MPIPFTKYSGCGNDFILIDNRHLCFSLKKAVIQRLCHRQMGIGADGLIFLEKSTLPNTNYRMRIYNADGSEAEMCGNGLRCLAQHIRTIEPNIGSFFIQTMLQCLEVSFIQNLVNVSMPSPSEIIHKKIKLETKEGAIESEGCSKSNPHFQLHPAKEISLYFLDTGVPHAVHFVDDLENDLLLRIAPSIRFHKEFGQQGTNVNFVKLLSGQALAIRTYERGVEQETLACGTGATAAAIAAGLAFDIPSPITVYTKSGDSLTINFQKKGTHFSNLIMSGPATKIFEGVLPESFTSEINEISLSHG